MRERRYLSSLVRLWMLLVSSQQVQEATGFVIIATNSNHPSRLGATSQTESSSSPTTTTASTSEATSTPWSSVDRLLQTVGTELDKIVPHFSDERQREEEQRLPKNGKASAEENRVRMRRRLYEASRLRSNSAVVSSVGLRHKRSSQRNEQHQQTVLLDMLQPSRRVSQSVIQNAIEDLMQKQQQEPDQEQALPSPNTAAFSSFPEPPSMGLLGEESTAEQQPPEILLQDEQGRTVRTAQTLEDVHIANLRLSVFADVCATTDRRSQFCAHSCQAMTARRRRGATCLVATTARNAIVGSAEGSFHEFFGTRLGQRRLPRSILYVTEVAVHPSARRRGLGRLLLTAMDVLAREREVETLYLHVDVENHGAIRLYEQAGYRRTSEDEDDVMYEEFTRSLNLHPGATKGRRHHLLYKDLVDQPTWLEPPQESSSRSNSLRREDCYEQSEEEHRLMVDAFGFEIPA